MNTVLCVRVFFWQKDLPTLYILIGLGLGQFLFFTAILIIHSYKISSFIIFTIIYLFMMDDDFTYSQLFTASGTNRSGISIKRNRFL